MVHISNEYIISFFLIYSLNLNIIIGIVACAVRVTSIISKYDSFLRHHTYRQKKEKEKNKNWKWEKDDDDDDDEQSNWKKEYENYLNLREVKYGNEA